MKLAVIRTFFGHAFYLHHLNSYNSARCHPPHETLPSACPGRQAQGEGSLANPSSLPLFFPAPWTWLRCEARECHSFHPGPWQLVVHNSLPLRTQPATPWTGGTWVSPLNSIPPTFSDSDTGIHPVTFKCTHQAPEMQEQQKQETAGFPNKDSSVRNPGHAVIRALSVSELQELARQVVQQTPLLSVCLSTHLSICRNSEARLLCSILGFSIA